MNVTSRKKISTQTLTKKKIGVANYLLLGILTASSFVVMASFAAVSISSYRSVKNLISRKLEKVSQTEQFNDESELWSFEDIKNQDEKKRSKPIEFAAGELIIKLKLDDNIKNLPVDKNVSFGVPAVDSLNAKHKVTSMQKVFRATKGSLVNVYKLKFPKDADIKKIAEDYRQNQQIEYAEPNWLYYTSIAPNDSDYSKQWHHEKISSEDAWAYEQGDENIVIGVIDSGVYYVHPDLSTNIWQNSQEAVGDANNDGYPGIQGVDDDQDGLIDEDSNNYIPSDSQYTNDLKDDDDENGYKDDIQGYDFVDIDIEYYEYYEVEFFEDEDYSNFDSEPLDFYGHGTHVAGIIAARSKNAIGVAGVCGQCSILPIRAGFAIGAGGVVYGILEDDDIARAIEYAAEMNVNIVNMSFGNYNESKEVKDAILFAQSKGVFFVASAGNDNTDYPSYPASYDGVMAVAATDQSDKKTYFSNYGSWIDVSAPGVDMYSTLVPNAHLGDTCNDDDGDGYGYCSGTSMAAPVIAGTLGLVKSFLLDYSMEDDRGVKSLVYNLDNIYPVNFPGLAGQLGFGRVNAMTTVVQAINAKINGRIVYQNFILSDEDGNNNNNKLEAGETIEMSIIFYNLSDEIAEVNFFLSTNDPYVTLIDAMSSIANIAPNSQTNTDNDPFKFSLSASIPYGHEIIFDLLSDPLTDGRGENLQVTTDISFPYQSGWDPMDYNAISSSFSPIIADLDTDGSQEVVLTTTTRLKVLNSAGKQEMSAGSSYFENMIGEPTVSDLDGDEKLEIVVPEIECETDCKIHAFRFGDTPSEIEGWPIALPKSEMVTSAAIGDIDHNGDNEVVFGVTRGLDGMIYVLKGDGSFHEGWPVMTNQLNYPYEGFLYHPLLADLDVDEDLEIIFGSVMGDRTLYVFHHNGDVFTGDWPKGIDNAYLNYAPVSGDIDNDGQNEIVIGSMQGFVFAFENDGSIIENWPVSVEYLPQSIVLSDLDNDKDLEILVGGYGWMPAQVSAFHHDGLPVNGWPVTLDFLSYSYSSVGAVGNFDEDEQMEVVVNSSTGPYIINHDGSLMTGARSILNVANDYAAPVIGDLDGDGDIEIISGFYDSHTRAWDLTTDYNLNLIEWPVFRHNPAHTGNYSKLSAPELDYIPNQEIVAGKTLTLVVSAKDPQNKEISFSVEGLPQSAVYSWETITSDEQGWQKSNFILQTSKEDIGSYQLFFKASNDQTEDEEIVLLDILENDRPEFTSELIDQTVNQGNFIKFDLTAIDGNGDKIIFSIDGLPEGANYSIDTWPAWSGVAPKTSQSLSHLLEDANGPRIKAVELKGIPQKATFYWQTSPQDEGEFKVNFLISDGFSSAKKTVNFSVYPKIEITALADISGYPDHGAYPDIYGEKVVWFCHENMHDDFEICLFDNSSKEIKLITNNSSEEWDPRIYENYIIYESSSGWLTLYNLLTNNETKIWFGQYIDAEIWGEKIVWADEGIDNNSDDIFVYDITSAQTIQITNDEQNQIYPDIYSNKVIWVNGGKIELYDLETQELKSIPNMNSYAGYPKIYGDNIVWIGDGTGWPQFYVYNLQTQTTQMITTNKNIHQSQFYDIYGDKIIWDDARNTVYNDPENYDIYMYDLTLNREIPLINDDSEQRVPVIYENNIAWTDDRDGEGTIFFGQIEP